MLYLWPFMAFFSLPAIYPYLLLPPLTALAQLPAIGTLEPIQIFKRRHLLPRLGLTLLLLALACTLVRANTIVHPFTLADNRHYIFYIFKRLLHPWWLRYAVTPLYLLTGWACLQALGGGPPLPLHQRHHRPRPPPSALPDSAHAVPASFLLIWLATSALQLVTAPLVEPRYFILPWLFWRLHLPLRLPSPPPDDDGAATRARLQPQPNPKTTPQTNSKTNSKRNPPTTPPPLLVSLLHALWHDYDHRLWLETAWLLAINLATGYLFLAWGFEWPQEPGKVQRFMW